MLTNIHNSWKRPFRAFSKSKPQEGDIYEILSQNYDLLSQDKEFMSFLRTESAIHMRFAHHFLAAIGVLIAFMLLFIIALYNRHGHAPGSFIELTCVTSTTMIIYGAWLWRNARRFFLIFHQK